MVEGERELYRALEMGYNLKKLFFRSGTEGTLLEQYFDRSFELSEKLFDRVSIRSGSEEVLAILEAKNHDLEQLQLHQDSRIMVIEAPEKPGNIGALLRTAAAAQLDAVIISNPKTDLYHPHIIRNSLGGIFALPIATEQSEKVISFLEKNQIHIISAALHAEAKHYKRIKYQKPFALVFGAEDKGLGGQWLKKSNQMVKIPVAFPIDSLNLSVSAGILIYHSTEQ